MPNPRQVVKSGERFGMLVVLEQAGVNAHQKRLWRCRCDCGQETTFPTTGQLRSGTTTSCGCRKAAAIGESRTTHGLSGTRAHMVWKNMRQRVLNPRRKQYKDWGGRGITIDSRWDKFENFLADMGEPPPGLSLERKNNNGPYSKDNCVWAGRKEQNRNRRITARIEFDGKSLTMAEWSADLGVDYQTLLHRFRRGWSVRRALSPGTYHRFGKFTPSKEG